MASEDKPVFTVENNECTCNIPEHDIKYGCDEIKLSSSNVNPDLQAYLHTKQVTYGGVAVIYFRLDISTRIPRGRLPGLWSTKDRQMTLNITRPKYVSKFHVDVTNKSCQSKGHLVIYPDGNIRLALEGAVENEIIEFGKLYGVYINY